MRASRTPRQARCLTLLVLCALTSCRPRVAPDAIAPAPSADSTSAGAGVQITAAVTRDEFIGAKLATVLREAVRLDSLAGHSAWPGFRLRDQVLMLSALPNGPLALIGDSAPPPDFHRSDSSSTVFFRPGPPPDSLAGLRIALDWHGRAQAATIVPGDELSPHTLVHESFHTYQHQHPGHFAGRTTLDFPDTVTVARALLALELRWLGRALTDSGEREATNDTRLALALRARRCQVVGQLECSSEEHVEQIEGTAEYVAARVLASGSDSAAPRGRRPEAALALQRAAESPAVERTLFYATGHAWLLLLERLDFSRWQRDVESSPPARVLDERLGVDARTALVLQSVLVSPAAHEAEQRARTRIAQELAERDAVVREFESQQGTRVRVRAEGTWSQVRSNQVPSGAQVRVAQRRERDGAAATYSLGVRELTVWYGRGETRLRAHDAVIERCCTPPSYEVITPLAGGHAMVNGAALPLDRAGVSGSGTILLSLPRLELRADSARVEVFSDSVIIHLIR